MQGGHPKVLTAFSYNNILLFVNIKRVELYAKARCSQCVAFANTLPHTTIVANHFYIRYMYLPICATDQFSFILHKIKKINAKLQECNLFFRTREKCKCNWINKTGIYASLLLIRQRNKFNSYQHTEAIFLVLFLKSYIV